MKKLTLLAGVAVGYVLGARAGRERYDQIADAAGKVRRNPRVQSVVDDVQAEAAEAAEAAKKAAATVKETVTDAVKKDPTVPDPPDVAPPGSTS